MNIGIIGSGNMGSTLAKRLTFLGHKVYIANSRGPESLTGIAEQTGAVAVTAKDAVAKAQLLIVSIPQKNILDLPADLFNAGGEALIIVDTCNYYPKWRDGEIAGLDSNLTESEWMAQQAGRPVIKAFNNINAHNLADDGKPTGEANRIALAVSGDNPQAKAIVMQLVDDLGFDPVDNGLLKDSWRQQPGTPIYCTNLTAIEVRQHFAQMGTVRTPTQRETMIANRNIQEDSIIAYFRGLPPNN